jgi:hypothetical protein
MLPCAKFVNVDSQTETVYPKPEYDANGVDLTLIRACLRETPLQCLEMLEEMHQLAESVGRDSESIPSTD